MVRKVPKRGNAWIWDWHWIYFQWLPDWDFSSSDFQYFKWFWFGIDWISIEWLEFSEEHGGGMEQAFNYIVREIIKEMDPDSMEYQDLKKNFPDVEFDSFNVIRTKQDEEKPQDI